MAGRICNEPFWISNSTVIEGFNLKQPTNWWNVRLSLIWSPHRHSMTYIEQQCYSVAAIWLTSFSYSQTAQLFFFHKTLHSATCTGALASASQFHEIHSPIFLSHRIHFTWTKPKRKENCCHDLGLIDTYAWYWSAFIRFCFPSAMFPFKWMCIAFPFIRFNWLWDII